MGVEDIRGSIALANDKMRESIAALQQSNLVLEEAQGALAEATRGSGQSDIQQALGALAEAMQMISGAQSMVDATITSAEGYANRL